MNMKLIFSVRFASAVLLALVPLVMPATDAVKIEAVLYLFRSVSINHVDFSKARQGLPPISGNGIVFGQPATVVFERERLVLHGASYSWNDDGKIPHQFSKMGLPTMVAELGQAVSIRADVPVQFLEKMPDGSLQVREGSGTLPDLPHYQLTLNVRSGIQPTYGYDLIVTCQMDVSTMQGREKIPGLDLDVGRPILARFDRKVEFWAKHDGWSGVWVDSPSDGDYNLLVLLKVSPIRPAPAALPPK